LNDVDVLAGEEGDALLAIGEGGRAQGGVGDGGLVGVASGQGRVTAARRAREAMERVMAAWALVCVGLLRSRSRANSIAGRWGGVRGRGQEVRQCGNSGPERALEGVFGEMGRGEERRP
jgi:hypothetical protein